MSQSLLQEAKSLTRWGFAVIPIKEKKPPREFPWTNRRKKLANEQELVEWFSNGKVDRAAITIDNTEFGIDIDGEKCESMFVDEIVPTYSPGLQDKISSTMLTKTPNKGYHRTFKINPKDFSDGIKKREYLSVNGEHGQILLIGKDNYLIERGAGYEPINGVECVVTLTKSEVEELLAGLETYKKQRDTIVKAAKILKPYYIQPHRDKIIFALSGYLHKGKTPKCVTIEIAQRLIDATGYDDENPNKIFQTIRDTYKKDPDSDQVSGYKRLHEALTLASPPTSKKDDASNTITEIEYTLKGTGLFTIPRREHQQAQQDLTAGNIGNGEIDEDETDELRGIDDTILVQLDSHVYAIVSSSPPLMYVAHRGKRKIIKAYIKSATETTTTTEGSNIQHRKQLLLWKQQLIFAIPVKVVINENPLDNLKTYQVTFVGRSKKPFTLGPGSINYIIEELASKGKVLKKNDAVDALTAILNRYEELGLAEIKESVTQPGYYYTKGKFETYEVKQIIDKEPDPNEILACTCFLDELSTKWQNEDIFPTVIKWTALAPFNYIFIVLNRWLKNIHDHGWSSSGKTSLGKIALAVWRLHTNALKRDYQLTFGNVDNAARFGAVISRSTYPKLINEVGGLQDKLYRSLLELIKGAIESPYVRGKFFDGKYQNILALCNLFLTSNSRPPDDSGYRSKTTLIQHTKDEVHERGQKEAIEFEKWLDSNLHILGVLGDFIARYIIVKPTKPEESIIFSNMSYDDMAKEIIAEFYKSVGKEKPVWLDRIFEQRSIIEENTEQANFEIRGFLMDQVTEVYSRHIRTIYNEKDPDPKLAIDFKTRLNFCLNNKLIPYLHEHSKRDGIQEIVITHDILAELKRAVDHIEGVTTMGDLGKEIPGFEYTNRKLGGKARRVLAGSRNDFVSFLEGGIAENDDE